MNKGYTVDESTLWKSIVGLIGLLFIWNNNRVNSAHKKIEDERTSNEERDNKIYERINETHGKIEKYRADVKKDLEVRMTEPHIKEYVGLKIEPLANKVSEIHTDVKALLARANK